MNLQDERDLLSPPGDTILEHLKFELSQSLKLPSETIEDLLTGKAEITDDIALRLEHRFGISRAFWLQREKLYRQKQAELE